MNKPRSRCLAIMVAFTVTSFFVVMQGSFLSLSSPSKSIGMAVAPVGPTGTITTKNASKSNRKHRLFRRYLMEDECIGKETLLDILQNSIDVKRCKVDPSRREATKPNLPSPNSRTTRRTVERHVYGMTTCELEDLCAELPQWKQIKNAYGPLPVVLGTDSCSPAAAAAAQQSEGKQKQQQPSAIDIAGLFSNAGTDLLATTLHMNYPNLKVHNLNFTAAIKFQRWHEDTLRVVVVRDPFRWMAAMCMSNQGVSWLLAPKHHCPNLVPSGGDHSLARRLKTYSVETPSGHRYRTLADLWSSFYLPYLTDDVVKSNRILLVRYEDILFRVESVLDSILACVGDLTTQTKNSRLPYFAVSDITSQRHGRYAGMTDADLVYAKKAIPSWMLHQLQYRPVPDV